MSKCAYCGCEYDGFQTKCDEGCGAPLSHAESQIETTSLDSVKQEFISKYRTPHNYVSLDWISS